MSTTIDYGIISAVSVELAPLQNACNKKETITVGSINYTVGYIADKKVAMVASGIGTTCVASVMTALIKDFNPKAIFFSGMAGAIDPNLNLGDIVIGSQAFEAEIQNLVPALKNTTFEETLNHPFKNEIQPSIFSADPRLLQLANILANKTTTHEKITTGILVSSNNFPAPKELFDDIKKKKALAIDMESSAIYQVSWLLGTPSLVIRSISNKLDETGEDKDVANSATTFSSESAAKFLIKIISEM